MKNVSFECRIKLNTRTIMGIIAMLSGIGCIVVFKDPAYWTLVGLGIICMVGGKVGNITIANGANGSGGVVDDTKKPSNANS